MIKSDKNIKHMMRALQWDGWNLIGLTGKEPDEGHVAVLLLIDALHKLGLHEPYARFQRIDLYAGRIKNGGVHMGTLKK